MKSILTFLCLCGMFLPLASARTIEKWEGSGDISFSGTSTLHDWAGTVAARPFAITVTRGGDGLPERVLATVSVDAAKMDTAEEKRDENMHRAMKVTEFPLVKGVIDASAEEIAKSGEKPVQLPIQLILLGKKQAVNGTISNWKLSGGEASFDLDFKVSLKASGIKVPAVAFVIRVGDTVSVHVKVKLRLP